jgi:hypothetical protein
MVIDRIAVVGGTGPHGRGLAQRLAAAGCAIVVGSREPVRAERVAAAIRKATGNRRVDGARNLDAVLDADATIVAVPAVGLAPTLELLRERLAGRLVIDVVVPLVLYEGMIEYAPPLGARSAGELAQRLLPESRVVAAFKTIPAAHFAVLEQPLEGDVLVCGDDAAARASVAALVARLPKLRAIDAGPMRNVRSVEAITALLVNLNRIHHGHASIRILGI